MCNPEVSHGGEVLVDQPKECLVGSMRVLLRGLLPPLPSRLRRPQGPRLPGSSERRRTTRVG